MTKLFNKISNLKDIFRPFGVFLPKESVPLYWWPGMDNRNFGDVITPYIVEKISNKKIIWVNRYCLKEHYMGAGSIISSANKNSIIWGSGLISRHLKVKKPKKILAVRGPLTRKRLLELGISCPEIYGDPALILPNIYKPKTKKTYSLGIIPHYVDYKRIKDEIKSDDILIIDILDPVEKVIDDIYSCQKTISSSLHGVITSHAYKIPSILVKFSNKLSGDGIKFKDYFLSVEIKPYEAINLTEKIDTAKLIKLINKINIQKPTINTDKLWEVCPFFDNKR